MAPLILEHVLGLTLFTSDMLNNPTDNDNEDMDTFANWPDPDNKLAGIRATVKKHYRLNRAFEAYDVDNNLVHPSNYEQVFARRVWALGYATLR